MKQQDSIEAILDDHADTARVVYRNRIDDLIKKHNVTSFVEKMYLGMWLIICDINLQYPEIIPQKKFGKYRVDFYIPKTNTVIEIDSFTFHERDSNQLEYERIRHREIEASGVKIIRFAATEVLKDCFGCVVACMNPAISKKATLNG